MLSKYGSLEGKDHAAASTVGEDNAAIKVQAALRGKDRKSIVAANGVAASFRLRWAALRSRSSRG